MAERQRSTYLSFVVFTILLGAFQYGYHIGELNTPQSVIANCPAGQDIFYGLPNCIPMKDAQYSLVVSMLTAGGLVGALSASYWSDRVGRRKTLSGASGLLGLGSAVMLMSTNYVSMLLGRFLAGLGSGIATVIVPAYVAECVPKEQRGFFGALNQLSIVVGILVAQILGLAWSTPTQWRGILGMGVILSLVQLILLSWCVESPRYLATLPQGLPAAKRALIRLRGRDQVEGAHLEMEEWQDTDQDTPNLNLLSFLTSARYRPVLGILCLLQLGQQFSGINAVIFYSTSIMSSIFPNASAYITVYISIVNVVMTIISANMMDTSGRRKLFMVSSGAMGMMSFLLGWAMAYDHSYSSAFAIIGFVMAYAIGLGPIPFLMIPELVDTRAASSAGSASLSVNMISNFVVASGFLGLRDFFGAGRVFGLFGLMLLIVTAIAYRILPETKGRSAEEVMQSQWAVHNVHPGSGYRPIHNDLESDDNRVRV